MKLLPVPVPLPYGRNVLSTSQSLSPNAMSTHRNNRGKRRDHMEKEYEETLDSADRSMEDGLTSVECVEFNVMDTEEVFGLSLHTHVVDPTKSQWCGFMEMPFQAGASSEKTKERHIQLIDELMAITSPPPTPGSDAPSDQPFFEDAAPPSASGHQIDVDVEVTMYDGQLHSTSLRHWTMMSGSS